MDRLLRALGSGPSGKIDDRFEILGEAGMGGMGTIYRAHDTATGCDVALKIITAPTRVFADRFALEAKVLAELRHPGIVGYVAHGKTAEGEAYLAMEWLDGESLSRRLGHGRLGVRESLSLGRQVADALIAAHEKGVIHRDLKPSNLYFTGDPEVVKILDFGIARARDAAVELTRTGEVVGTPGYISPEQARGLRDIDGRADLFSLGCVLYRCVTGERAFGGDDILSLLAKLILAEPARAREVNEDVPAALEGLIDRMLAKSPEERPEDARVVRDELDRMLEELEASSPPTLRQGQMSARRSFHGAAPEAGRVILAGPARGADGEPAMEVDVAAATARVSELGGRLIQLAGGGFVATLPEGVPADVVAACARVVTVNVPGGHAALVTGRPDATLASMIDEAGRLLADAPAGSIRVPASRAATVEDVGAALRAVGLDVDVARDGSEPPASEPRDAKSKDTAKGAKIEPPPLTLASAGAGSSPGDIASIAATRASAAPTRRNWSTAAGVILIVAALATLAIVTMLRGRSAPAGSTTVPSASGVAAPAAAPAPLWAIDVGGPGRKRAVAVARAKDRVYAAIASESEGGREAAIAAFDDNGEALFSVGLQGPESVDVQSIAATKDGVYATGFFHRKIHAGKDTSAEIAGKDGVFYLHVDTTGKVTALRGYGGPDLALYLGKVSIAADDGGRVVIAGGFGGTLSLPGCKPLEATDELDAFVARVDTDGTCRWADRVGKAGLQAFEWAGIDLSKQITVAGEMHGTVDVGGKRLESVGGIDVLVVRYDEDGAVKWSRRAGNPSGLQGSVRGAVQPLGAVYLAGWFDGALDFGPGDGTYTLESAGDGHDLFVVKLDASSRTVFTQAIRVERSPCPPDNCALDRIGLTVDPSGRSYVTFPFEGHLEAGSMKLDARGGADLAILSLDAGGKVDLAAQLGDEGASCKPPRCVLAASAGPGGVAIAGGFTGELGVGGVRATGEEDAFVMMLSGSR